MYYLFGYVIEKHYVQICDVCGNGVELNASDVESDLGHNPIPYMHRFGCLAGILAGLAGFLALLVFAYVEEQMHKGQRKHGGLNSPTRFSCPVVCGPREHSLVRDTPDVEQFLRVLVEELELPSEGGVLPRPAGERA
ncbi:MAG: hypothetical protein HZA46_16225 [Planctomycetales bacterium]|nr:hypothetical protein [Planctomycetales bacterium]